MASKLLLVVANNNGWTRVGKYEVGRTLGESNFAKVKFARNVDTGENVAIKILNKEKILKHKMITQMHTKGSCHRAAESKLNETELRRQDKINKQVALSDSSTGTANCNAYHQKFRSVGKPLIEQTRNLASEILNNKTPQQNSSNANHDLQLILDRLTDGNSNLNQNSPCPIEVTDKVVVQPHLDFQERRERELKFTAAGWKHDCQGKWFRDENVEFDSDEDDPNVCLG